MKRETSGYVYGLLGAIATISALLLAVLWLSDPEPDTLTYEAAKGCIGIFTVALVGVVVSYAASTLQRDRERRDQEGDRRREDWRRDLEQRRDERQRKDALLRSLLDDALTNYNDVKRARRQLRARIWAQEQGDQVDSDVYDEYLTMVNDAQLNFEVLKRTVLLLDDERVDPGRLANRFRVIEEYLNELVSEYEAHRRHVSHGPAAVGINELSKLEAFFDPDDSDPFRSGASTNLNDAIDELRAALLDPLRVPPVTADVSARENPGS